MQASEIATRLLGPREQGAIRSLLGRVLDSFNRLTGRYLYDRQRLEYLHGTPLMILEMELTSGDAIAAALPGGFVTVGTEVDIRHLGASLVGSLVRTTAKVIAVERRVIRFEVEAYEGERKIGDGRHARGLVNVENFNRRLVAK